MVGIDAGEGFGVRCPLPGDGIGAEGEEGEEGADGADFDPSHACFIVFRAKPRNSSHARHVSFPFSRTAHDTHPGVIVQV